MKVQGLRDTSAVRHELYRRPVPVKCPNGICNQNGTLWTYLSSHFG